MKCVSEGELRAFLDRELADERILAIEGHVGECAQCARRLEELSARAVRVAAWMEDLSEAVPVSARPERRRQWWPAVAGFAAAAALFVLAYPRHVVEAPAPGPAAVVTPAPVAAPAPAAIAVPPPVRRARKKASRASNVDYYLALDADPIDTGFVMRVALESGQEADVIVDGGGRARAIRPVLIGFKENER